MSKPYRVFASSLRSLVSPWARSLDAHYPRSPARWPRPVAPPPPPRRNSDPTSSANNNPNKKHRRYSDIRNPTQIDLRQELLDLHLNNREVEQWLGNKFTEIEEDVQSVNTEVEDFRFNHDIPLQRSISLDRGIEIFNYLQTLSSDSESSTDSSWSLQSEEQQNRLIEQYRSFEDIPATHYKIKNRRASVAVHNETYDQSQSSKALYVLKESYKGIDDAGVVKHASSIKKLQKTYSFKNFDDIRELDKSSGENRGEIVEKEDPKKKIFSFTMYDDVRDCGKIPETFSEEIIDSEVFYTRERMGTSNENLQLRGKKPMFSLQGDESVKNPVESVEKKLNFENPNTIVPIIKSVSFKADDHEDITAGNKGIRQRRIGVIGSPPPHALLETIKDSNKKQDLRKEVMMKQNISHCKSSEQLITLKKVTVPRSGSAENVVEPTPSTSGILKRSKDQSLINLRKLKRNFSLKNLTDTKRLVLPAEVISNVSLNEPVPKTVVENEDSNTTNDSNVVVSNKTCDCRICMEDEVEDKMFYLRRNLKNLFIKIVSCRDYGKKLVYWDITNKLDENEMYNSIMHLLKLMLGLWLRHFDHN